MEKDLIKNNPVQKFLRNFLLFLFLLVIADFAVGFLLRKFYFSQESGLEARTIYAIDKANEELIVLGSSRASHHYVPAIIGKELNMSAYNAGREGNFILYHNAVLQCMIQRYHPKVVVLDLLNKEFSVNRESYDRLATLMPFYRNHEAIRPIINLRGPFEPIKNLSAIYPYNSKLQAIAMGNLELNKSRKQDFGGYIPLERVMKRPADSVAVEGEYPIDTIKVEAFRQLVKTCSASNIRLFVICSPYYDYLRAEDPSVRIARQIAAEYSIPFWDYSVDTTFTGKADIFDDKAHLNKEGAERYSKLIADKITASAGSHASAKR
ncbi:hypothetical protein [Flavihumibacter petaseus]|uniref:Uncharacterized protein n=1 Tax=Flavihumibacter petaseus NBRC 106054 TaxID=1220578 RepID=A0A0E9N2W4_9BACT|nr:hypothetical protein [Flavihumibacter petaseus]GAO44332.1 hypothetical protein FPE01S_03_03700 [Flavihumibacter petaseus NBRC 106054]